MSADPQSFVRHTAQSVCCGAPIVEPDFCSACLEHCSIEVQCEDCGGAGVDQVAAPAKCQACDGEGFTIEP